MSIKSFFFKLIIVVSSFAEIYTNEVLVRIGEAIDFDSGLVRIPSIDSIQDIETGDCPNNVEMFSGQSLCRCSEMDKFDIGFYYTGTIVDCFGAPSTQNCTETLKALFSPKSLFEFKNNDFYKNLNVSIDTSDTSKLLKYQLNDLSFWDNKNVVSCSLSQGYEITILDDDYSLCKYYYLITEKGNECIFTVIKRDTVEEYCEFNRYNALKIKYYLKTDKNSEFTSIENEIRERIVTRIDINNFYLVLKNERSEMIKTSRYDLLGRIQNYTLSSSMISINKLQSKSRCTIINIK